MWKTLSYMWKICGKYVENFVEKYVSLKNQEI